MFPLESRWMYFQLIRVTDNQYSTCIIENELDVRQALVEALSESDNFSVVGEAGSYEEGIELLKNKIPDVAFMDVELTRGNAFQIIEQLIKDGCQIPKIILNTGFSELELSTTSLDIYKKYVVHRLEKPFWHNWGSIENTIVEKIDAQMGAISESVRFSAEKFSISKEYQTFYIDYSDLLYIEVAKAKNGEPKPKGKIMVGTKDDEYEITGSLTAMIQELPDYFKQIRRSTIVNTQYIKMADRANLLLLLKNVQDKIFYIGESYKSELFDYLDR